MKSRFTIRNLKIFLAVIIIISSCASLTSAQENDDVIVTDISDEIRQEYVPGEILVKFKPSINKSITQSIHRQMNSIVLEEIPGRIERVKIREGLTVKEAISEYMKNPEVEHVQPNFIYYLDALVLPDDTFFGELWGLHNIGQSVNGASGTFDADIDAPEAWDIVTGSSTVIVAVIDTGIDRNHPDLSANVWRNLGETSCSDGMDNDGNGYVDDCYGWDFFDDDNDPPSVPI